MSILICHGAYLFMEASQPYISTFINIDEKITYKSIHLLLDILSSHSICAGQPDDSFLSLVQKKGSVFS